MNKFKKAAADLLNYLGRDSQGLGLLKKMTDAGNDIRHELATVKAALVSASEIARFSARSCDEAKRELQNARDTILHQESLLSQLRVTVRMMEANTSKSAEVIDECASENLTDPKAIGNLMLRLKKEIPQAPSMSYQALPKENTCHRNLHSIINGYGGDQMIKLGMLVAASAIISGNVVIFADPKLPASDDENDTVRRRYVRWLKPNIDFSTDESIESKIAGSKAIPPRERAVVSGVDVLGPNLSYDVESLREGL